MRKINCWKTAGAIFLLCAATGIALPAQTLKVMHNFDGTDGVNTYAGLIQGISGGLYGTTYEGGAYGHGTVFEITPSGALTTLYSFCVLSFCADGEWPMDGLIQATDGNFYGTTVFGGTGDGIGGANGTVFKITPTGTLTTLHTFCAQGNPCSEGEEPYAALIQATDGNLYGTTYFGGTNGEGTVFKITSSGTLTTVYSFCSQSNCTDGELPTAGLVQATDGNFYGTTYVGGANQGCFGEGCGTVFKLTPGGALTTLYSFCSQSVCTDGAAPYAGLVQATDGSFYGTTYYGGANQSCNSEGCGTVFKISPSGTLTTLYSFCSQSGCADGSGPEAGLIQAANGSFYGTTEGGGANNYGTVFKITPSGTLTTLHSFDRIDGALPLAGLVQDTNGTFYGTTYDGGVSNDGTIFSLSVGLSPFVETQPAFGKVGKAIKILGTNLTGTTSVTFNGTPAAFTVEAGSVIKTTIPAGATTGTVQVVTPSGTLSSNVKFRVVP